MGSLALDRQCVTQIGDPASDFTVTLGVTDEDLLRVTDIASKYLLNCMLLMIFRPLASRDHMQQSYEIACFRYAHGDRTLIGRERLVQRRSASL